MLEVVKIKAVLLNFYVSLFHVEKKLKRTKYKPENEHFSSSVSLSSTHACSYKIDNFILKSHVTFTKLFSNWLYGGKIPKQLDAVPSGNKFSKNFSGLDMLNRESQSHSVRKKLKGIYIFPCSYILPLIMVLVL